MEERIISRSLSRPEAGHGKSRLSKLEDKDISRGAD
jgi:hypothetical protein